jgi:hypothetical protein
MHSRLTTASCTKAGTCYNRSTMSNYPTPVDISNMPDLLDLVAEVEATNTPRELRRDNKPVALLC